MEQHDRWTGAGLHDVDRPAVVGGEVVVADVGGLVEQLLDPLVVCGPDPSTEGPESGADRQTGTRGDGRTDQEASQGR